MIFDTNALSAWVEEDPKFREKLVFDRPYYLPSIALGEFRFGIEKSNVRDRLIQWLDRIESACQILVPDEVTARNYGVIRFQMERTRVAIPYHDIWIAALAVQHNLPILSQDRHFEHIPHVRLIRW